MPSVRGLAAAGRTSLACTKCRHRKVKCSGDWPRCKSCFRRSDECEYPGLDSRTTSPLYGERQETMTYGSQRTPVEGVFVHDEPSDDLPPPDVIAEATEIFLASYSGFPFWFIRRHIFREELAEGQVSSSLLFCILSVVARFVKPCYEIYGGTVEASAHFASRARERVSKMNEDISLLGIHCNLILGLYELGHGDEHRAWLRVGTALRICQLLSLPFESSYSNDDSVTAELKRRTFWSCYSMERLLVNGRDRPLLVPNFTISTNLPTSANDFVVGRVAYSSTLSAGSNQMDSLQASTVRITDLLSRIVQWGGGGIGGRHDDPRSPWLQDMPYSQLQTELQQWRSSLPSCLTLNAANIRAHLETGEDKLFGLMHLFYLTAGIRLYRKYLPFIPPQFYDPAFEGPCDGPELLPGPECPGFWGETARMGIKYAVAMTAAFMQLGKHNFDPWITPLSSLPLMESSMMLSFIVHSNWMTCEEFHGDPARNMLARNLKLLIKMRENWPVAAFRVKYLRLFYERVSLSQNPAVPPHDSDQPPLWTIKEALLHFNRSDQAKEGLTSYLPQKQHDLFSLLDDNAIA